MLKKTEAQYARTVVSWWTNIYPSWQDVIKDPIDVQAMQASGPNGYLSILACLSWWVTVYSELEERECWEDICNSAITVLQAFLGERQV